METGAHPGVGRSGESVRGPGITTQHDQPGLGSRLSKIAAQEMDDTPTRNPYHGRGRETIGAAEGETGPRSEHVKSDLASRQEKSGETNLNREAGKGRDGMQKDAETSEQPQVPYSGKAPSFAGLKLPMRQKLASQQERSSEASEQAKAEGRGKGAETPDRAREAVLKALERHADAIADAARMKGLGLPVVAHQRVALEKSGETLEQVKPGATKLLQSAHRYDPEAKRVIEGDRAPDRAEKLLEATEREGTAQQDPAIRAGRYAERWNALRAEEKAAGRSISREQRDEFAAGRKAIAAEIGNDPEAARKLAQDPERHGIERKSPIGEALRSGKTGQSFTEELERHEQAQDQGHEH